MRGSRSDPGAANPKSWKELDSTFLSLMSWAPRTTRGISRYGDTLLAFGIVVEAMTWDDGVDIDGTIPLATNTSSTTDTN